MPYRVLSLVLLLYALPAISQQNSITGTIIDRDSRQKIESANVVVLSIADSGIIKGTVTDRKGNFELTGLPVGRYLLQSSFIGYEKSVTKISLEAAQLKQNLGVLEIRFLPSAMQEVKVSSTRSLLNASIDRKVYDVTKDLLAQSGNVSDLLKNVPSVEVDIEGQVSLRGSADVLILINGKPSPLMGRTRADALQQIPANTIERIEVITNPSARFKPDGSSGIINIVLKKNTKAGYNGTVSGNIGNRSRLNGAVSLNYKPGKLNLYSNYSIRQDYLKRSSQLDRTYLDSIQHLESYYNEIVESEQRPLSHVVTLGAEYNPDEHNTYGISGNMVRRNLVRNEFQKRFSSNPARLPVGFSERLRTDPEFEKEYDITGSWRHNFPKEDQELSIELNVSRSTEQENNQFTNLFYLPAARSSFDNTLINVDDRQKQFSVDYSQPLSDDSKIEAGYLGSFINQDLDFRAEYLDTVVSDFVKDPIRTNRFLYNEKVHALYFTYQHAFEKLGYSLGLRLEQALVKGNLVTKDSLIDNSYFKAYPTLHLSYKIKSGELQLNYSRRVNRPEGDDLNPFPEYRDPRNLQAGNPNLLPEIIHSVEFGYKWQNKSFTFVPSLYYRYKTNGFTNVVVPINDTILLSTLVNLSKDQSTGLELIFSAKAGNFFSSNLAANFFYNQIDASEIGFSEKKSIVSFSTNLNAMFTISKTTTAQLSSNYRSARLTPQGKQFATFVLNAGFRQDLFKKKFSVLLTASDILKTLQRKNSVNTTFFTQSSTGRRDASIIYFGLSYRFGKLVKKEAQENLQYDNNL